LKNTTIARKLVVLLCIALFSLVSIIAGAIYEMRSAQQRFETVQTTAIPAIILLGDTGALSAALRSAVRDYIIGGFLDDPAMMKSQQENLKNLKEKIAKNIERYERELLSGEEDKALLAKDKDALAAYLAEVSDVLTKVENKDVAGLSQQFSENGKFRIAAGILIKSFSDHALFNDKRAANLKQTGEDEYRRSMLALSVVGGVAMLMLGAIGFVLIRSIRASLGRMQSAMGSIKTHLDFTIRTDNNSGDEIGHTGRALDELLEIMQTNLGAIAKRVKSVSLAAGQMATTSSQVANAAHQQSESASNMAATVEQMTVSINHVGERAQDADRISLESESLARSGVEIIQRTVEDINGIATTVGRATGRIDDLVASSQQISGVIAVIREIADQTNLLALNAAIEAARAGEQGRGFAVVADEVRKLAERTAVSTQEVAATIESMRAGAHEVSASMESVVGEVDRGVVSAQEASKAIVHIGEGSRRTVETVEEITSAIREQASAMTSIARQVEHIAQMSEESSAAAGNSAQVAKNLDELADEVQQIVAAYKLG
jgi:methyl-accepting chemotaxis protein